MKPEYYMLTRVVMLQSQGHELLACIDFLCLRIVLRASALYLVWKPSSKDGWCACTENNVS